MISLENEMGQHSAQNTVLYTTIMEETKQSVAENSQAFLSLRRMVFMRIDQSIYLCANPYFCFH